MAKHAKSQSKHLLCMTQAGRSTLKSMGEIQNEVYVNFCEIYIRFVMIFDKYRVKQTYDLVTVVIHV